MANRKDFTLIGIGQDVQYGKNGGRWVWNVDHFESTSDGVTLAQVRVPTTPISANDAASKIYVDSIASGVDAKVSVRVATVVAGVLSSNFEAGDVIDGVTLVAGDRILVKNQTSNIENGIYTVEAVGAPTRATDADSIGELSGGTFVFVEEGAILADTGWVITTNGSLTPGVDGNDWVQFSAAGVITAGIGLSQTGSVFNTNVGATTISANVSDDLIVDSSATTGQVLLSAGAIGTEAVWGGIDLANANAVQGILDETNGGTGIAAYVEGDMLIGNGVNTLGVLPIGTTGQVLTSNGTTAAWITVTNTGAVITLTADVTFDGGATQVIGTVPAGGRVIKASIEVNTAWDATETIELGDVGLVDRLMTAPANDPEEAGIFSTDANHLYAADTVVNATVSAGLVSVGAAHVVIQYITP